MKNPNDFKVGVTLLSVVPFEFIIDQLKQKINNYETDPSIQNRTNLIISCQALFLKAELEQGGLKGLMEIIDDIEEKDKVYKSTKDIFEQQ